MFAHARIDYSQTQAFSEIIHAYLDRSKELQPFYSWTPDIDGIQRAIDQRSKTADREALVSVLNDRYSSVSAGEQVQKNIQLLSGENCFTVCTAHQPNLATGPLYVIYKILHVIRLAADLHRQLPGYEFVPIFYMGSEDADQEELNHFTIHGKKYSWTSGQQGAVGRMKVEKGLLALIDELESQVGVWPYGKEWVRILKESYLPGTAIQDSMFRLLHELFGKFGLIVLVADDKRLKNQLTQVMLDDLFTQKPTELVSTACSGLEKHFYVQAHPREINLFYLHENIRERIEKKGNQFRVCNTGITFTPEEIREELTDHPERFSPNVILRGLYQETILPNIAFVGGGGEIAYWLQFRKLFDHYQVPLPVLLLRNSFMLIEPHQREITDKLSLQPGELFQKEIDILNSLVEKEGKRPQLNGELKELEDIYQQLKLAATLADPSLADHVSALKKQAIARLERLQQKMLRAERKKLDVKARQVKKLKQELFPGNTLQERTENIGSYYAKYGPGIIDRLLETSLGLEQKFTIVTV